MKILAIDDLQDNLTTLAAIVHDALPACTLLTATGGGRGLELARAEDPDVILLDIIMPEMDGFEVCRRLKADAQLNSIPVIFLTALRTDRESRMQALAAGAELFLSKPIDEMELVAQILALAKIKASNRFKKLEKDELAALVTERTRELEQELARRQQAEQQAKQFNSLLAAALESTADGILVVDTAGKVTLFNQRFMELWQISEELAVARDDQKLLQFVIGQLQDPAGFLDGVQKLYRTPAADSMDELSFKDGRTFRRVSHPQRIGETVVGRVWSFRDITYRKVTEAVQSFLAQITSGSTGKSFFNALAAFLAENLRMDFVCIDVLEGDGLNARTLAVWHNGKFEDNVTYALKDTPCGDVVGKQVCCFTAGVTRLFPNDPVLQELRAESYAGVTLWSHDGNPIGLIAVISRNPLANRLQVEAALKTVAGRAAGELERLQVEETLRKSEERFKGFYEQSPLGYQSLNADGCFLDLNPSWERILGYSREEVLGTWFGDYLVPDQTALFKDRFPCFKKLGQVNCVEFEMRHKDGGVRTIAFDGRIEYDENGAFKRTHCILNDITEHKRAEREIKRQAAFAHYNPNPVLELSATGEILYFNAATLQMANSLGRECPSMILPPNTVDIVRDCLAANRSNLLLETVEQGRTISWSFFPVAQNNVVHCYAGDVTERKQAESALIQTKNTLQAAMDNSPAGIAIAGAPDGKLQYVNHAGLSIGGGNYESSVNGVGIDQYVASWKLFDLDGQRPLKPEEVPLVRALKFGETNRREFIIRRSDNDDRIVVGNAGPIRDDQGKMIAAIVVFSDITEHKQLGEQLRQAQKMEAIGQLAGGVAHDFNNILNGMFIQLDLLKIEGPLTTSVREGLNQLSKDAERAAALVRQLLLYSRRQMMQMRDLDLNEVVANFSKMLQRVVREDIRLQLQLNRQALPLQADPGMVEQVLMNLAVNSRDAMPKGGQLIIKTFKTTLDAARAQQLGAEAGPGDYVCLSVSDTGTGIPPEALPKIFEPFFTTKDVGKGTGLGLSSVFGIIKQHKGYIEVDNRPGEGVSFKVCFPASIAAPTTQPGLVAKEPASCRGTETILLVEDEDSLRKLTRKLLEQQGYQVLVAANGVEALDLWKLHRNAVNLLLTDVVMPKGISGLELGKRLQMEKPELKAIYISGYSQDAIDNRNEMRTGMNFLQKPIEVDSLLLLLRQVLDT